MTQERIKARISALTTAAEMIRSHGEEGFEIEDESEFSQELYNQEKLKVHNLLMKEATKFESKLK